MKNMIKDSIKNGNITVELVSKATGISQNAVDIVLSKLIENGEVINDNGCLTINTNQGDIMTQKTINNQAVQTAPVTSTPQGRRFRLDKSLNCTQEQADFAELVCKNKGKIFDAELVLIHRGAQILFKGCGSKAFKYTLGISGYSDKEPVEFPPMYLDWDDSALYDQGGIADQLKEFLGANTPKTPSITPAITAQVAGK